jgi:hypothetical protein
MKHNFRAWHNKAKAYMQHNKISQIFMWLEEGQDVIIELWTGLYDKNRIEIYSGDIVQDHDKTVYEVIFNQRNASFCLKHPTSYKYFDDDIAPGDLKIIGNIHTLTP